MMDLANQNHTSVPVFSTEHSKTKRLALQYLYQQRTEALLLLLYLSEMSCSQVSGQSELELELDLLATCFVGQNSVEDSVETLFEQVA